jgi:hypothetical protein
MSWVTGNFSALKIGQWVCVPTEEDGQVVKHLAVVKGKEEGGIVLLDYGSAHGNVVCVCVYLCLPSILVRYWPGGKGARCVVIRLERSAAEQHTHNLHHAAERAGLPGEPREGL